MKDTPPVIERKFRQMLMKRSGEERLKMRCSMHATAKALAKASLLQHPGAPPAEIKRLLFLHFYGTDSEPEEQKRIASALALSGGGDGRGRRVSIKPVDPTDLAVKSSSGVRESTAPYGKKRKSKRGRA